MAKELPKSTRRFGARYGRRVRLKYGLIERDQRAKYKCPYCSAVKVKRISVGIWECKKCQVKFTGKAYKV
ncbi:50S ribosomal protein L37ae [archaeon]|jgi:large subunit ribosomal protein L37Ae|nr:50S ribosomal protein L37ae [archaeon]MBT4273155.1 50S ribosomal protein L37ae [archaeon]MBT4461366.1 50S ribosomal protein L37ae [archaeon]MBT4858888.1 50S ribosomal protein L37ae [archaeon]MBT5423458.1 50S ribosomal protein L37ae [archaeon]